MPKVYRIIATTLLCILFSSCTRMDEYVEAAPVYELSPTLQSGDSVIVHKGDSLYSIAWSYGIDYRDIAAFNHLHAPYTLSVGQQLVLTPKHVAVKKRASTVKKEHAAQTHKKVTTSSVKQKTLPTVKAQKNVQKRVVKPAAKKQAKSTAKWHWQWPLKATSIVSSKQSVGLRGLDLITKKGAAVHAAGPGVVVYTGTGVKGYGQLVIVKHSQDYLTAYGFNEKIVVHDGQSVAIGQVLAYAGLADNAKPTVHFELRKHGKSVDPLQYLPKRTT